MILYIITPTLSIEHHIAWLDINTSTGSLIIHQGHAPAVFPITPYSQLVFKLKTGKEQMITVLHGVVHVTRDSIEAIISPRDPQ